MADQDGQNNENVGKPSPSVKKSAKKRPKKVSRKGTVGGTSSDVGDPKRIRRPYPIVPYREATQIGDAIFRFASGDRVRRSTLFTKMDRALDSGPTRQLIANSSKYGITVGSKTSEYIELTPMGRIACDPHAPARTKLDAQFKLAIDQVAPFKLLYESYRGKKLPAHEVLKDVLVDSDLDISNARECIDLFVVNVKDLGLLRTVASAETLISIEQALEELPSVSAAGHPVSQASIDEIDRTPLEHAAQDRKQGSKWDSICFYISPIGDDGSPQRKHSDLFLSMLVEPALKDLGLEVVRADKIAEPGMITSHILEHIKHAKLVVADLSLLNPNVFYEMALRHCVRLPIVQIIQKADRLPFDVNQVNSIIIDNTDIYTFAPKLETFRSEITTLARRALEDPEHVGNPISVFFPDFWR